MKINIIHHDRSVNMMSDAETLSFILKNVKEKPEVNHININTTKTQQASINIFLDNINMLHVPHAKYNILIPSQHYFHKNWVEMCQCMDLIICKTKYCYDIFSEFIREDKLYFSGWRSTCRYHPSVDKDRTDFLCFYTDPVTNNIQKLIDIWKLDYPVLNIVFSGVQNKDLKRINLPNINYIEDITPEKFEQLFNKCMVHFCLDETDCFNHNVNQCQLVGSVPVVVSKGPVMEVADPENCFMVSSTRKRYREGLGSFYKYTKEDLEDVVKKILNTSDTTLEIMGRNCKLFSDKKHNIFLDTFKKKMKTIFEITKQTKFNIKEYTDSDLPSLSIVTPVNNLKDIFKICVLNYTSTSYPRDRLEWVIVDDSDTEHKIEDLLPKRENWSKFNITYLYSDKKLTYSEKLNIGLDKCKHECVQVMNHDDFFYENGFKTNVFNLLKTGKRCVGMTNYGCFDINKYVSIINSSYHMLEYSNRLYTGSLCFYRDFWENNRFQKDQPLLHFMRNRFDQFSEVNYANILVGLAHSRNKDIREIKEQEPNGCHFNFSKKLFSYICSLDEKNKEDIEKKLEENEREKDEIRKLAETENTENIKEI